MLEKTGTITYPPFINEVAVYIGKLRDLYNYNLNEQHERFKRGERSEQVNILGVKGELIFSYYLQANNISHEIGRLLNDKPVSAYDILVENKKIDVKTVRTDAPDLLVNKEAHEKLKGINSYVFVQPLTNNSARYWIFKHDEVSAWKIKNVKYTDAYFLTIQNASNATNS